MFSLLLFPLLISSLLSGVESSLEGSKEILDSNRTQRFLVTTSTRVISLTTNTITNILTTFPSCFSILGNVPTCSSTVLSVGRRRRRSPGAHILESPITRVQRSDGVFVDLEEEIQASKTVPPSEESQSPASEEESQITELEIIGLPDCDQRDAPQNRQIPSIRQALITLVNTMTVRVQDTTTQTVINAATQTLKFTSAAAGDCLPTAILGSLSVAQCT
eukprot:TRINITY_DN1368_c0_g1_i1.p1 TRINITY_DN1368_c0_g1~~TRINITY_DN1368_c0_g1_i1.p1  ORF type:complete len:219 (-),score=38.20 TRINITY_DN1368_c0_g1_i1:54-710(-)